MKKQLIGLLCAAACFCIVGTCLAEPKNCPLCNMESSDVLCLMDLHTGEIGEIRIGRTEPSDDPSSFVFYLVEVAGCEGYCDTGVQCCHLELKKNGGINPLLFCHSCRRRLRELDYARYAILDPQYQTESVLCPIDSQEQIIGNYRVRGAEDGSFVDIFASQ